MGKWSENNLFTSRLLVHGLPSWIHRASPCQSEILRSLLQFLALSPSYGRISHYIRPPSRKTRFHLGCKENIILVSDELSFARSSNTCFGSGSQ